MMDSTVEFPECVPEEVLEQERQRLLDLEEDKNKVKPKKKKIPKKQKSSGSAVHDALYEQHIERMKNITTKVDALPPTFHPTRVTGISMLRDDANVYMKRTRENIMLLAEMSHTMRTHGAIVPFRFEEPIVLSGYASAVSNVERLERMNQEFGKRLLEVRSEVDSGLELSSDPHRREFLGRRKQVSHFVVPAESLRKYEAFNLQLPEKELECKRLLRPCIFFDVYLKDVRPMGRIVVELYTEAAPLVVLEMIRACICNSNNRFSVIRLFPNLWMEVELEVAPNTALKEPIEYDAKIIDHSVCNYVLSFSKEYCMGFPGRICMTLSFKPISVVNGTRVGFGRVIRGAKICDCLQSYGTKNGKLSRGIIFTSCGLL
ncbi:uncharacterized protein LOC115625798 [Scaptodrosophila lebanonensis]|uniref:Uncharacterized protein LOC115625798 n=1 Tax=Drosophila lebanonensis TaxID=7225 RepID=A0A6J2TLB9_DROLE|nr:uncharacterized protein LOC115625798 [Scaptodrosophila lebanonensis]